MWLSEFYEKRKKEKETGAMRYTHKAMSIEIGCTPEYLCRMLSGAVVISTKMADKIANFSNGEIDANDLIEISIEKHKKYLDRKEKIGNRLRT